MMNTLYIASATSKPRHPKCKQILNSISYTAFEIIEEIKYIHIIENNETTLEYLFSAYSKLLISNLDKTQTERCKSIFLEVIFKKFKDNDSQGNNDSFMLACIFCGFFYRANKNKKPEDINKLQNFYDENFNSKKNKKLDFKNIEKSFNEINNPQLDSITISIEEWNLNLSREIIFNKNRIAELNTYFDHTYFHFKKEKL